MPVNIPVHVETAPGPAGAPAANQYQTGTFTHPYPMTRVKNGDQVQWACVGPFQSLTVEFKPNSSPPTLPFPGITKVTSTAGPTPPLTATVNGNFHYTVNVTVGGITWTIGDCPELDVG